MHLLLHRIPNLRYFFVFIVCLPVVSAVAARQQLDICIYGSNSAGVIAAYTAKKMGMSVLLIEPSTHIGGLTTGGLGFTDIGNKAAITGLSLDFYRRIGLKYGKFEQWIFEPKVASSVYSDYLKEAEIQPLFNYRIVRVNKKGRRIQSIVLETSVGGNSDQITVKARQFIDCSYEGDLMAKAGVSYRIGREANPEYQEKQNGVQLKEKHQFPDGIDPYQVKGDSTSGLLWGISPTLLAEYGSKDSCVQAYNYRVCLTDDPENRIEIAKPDDYRPERYELLLRYLEKFPSKDLGAFLKMDRIGNHKTDINNNGPFSTDMIGMNHDYPDADYVSREEIRKKHENYTKGFLYFVGNDPRMPSNLREQMNRFGYPKDEFLSNNHWSPQMYIRESRRMVGQYVMTQANCEGRVVAEDKIGMAAYTMDSHNCQRLVINGMVKNEGDVQVKGFPPYPISYRSLLPKENECNNLLVPVCLSATHIAYGSIRMEPVFMVLGQSAAVAAALSIQSKTPLHRLNIAHIQKELFTNPLSNGSIPEVLTDNDSTRQISATGLWVHKTGGYGSSMLLSTKKEGTVNTVRFFPKIAHSATYKVYVYLHYAVDSPVLVTLSDGKNLIRKVVDAPTQSSGQHSYGDWVEISDVHFQANTPVYIELSDQESTKAIVADAVLCIPVSSF